MSATLPRRRGTGEENARRLAVQTKTIAEFLRAGGHEPPKLGRVAIVQGHCHHKAIMGLDAERALLEAMGVEWVKQGAGREALHTAQALALALRTGTP